MNNPKLLLWAQAKVRGVLLRATAKCALAKSAQRRIDAKKAVAERKRHDGEKQ